MGPSSDPMGAEQGAGSVPVRNQAAVGKVPNTHEEVKDETGTSLLVKAVVMGSE